MHRSEVIPANDGRTNGQLRCNAGQGRARNESSGQHGLIHSEKHWSLGSNLSSTKPRSCKLLPAGGIPLPLQSLWCQVGLLSKYLKSVFLTSETPLNLFVSSLRSWHNSTTLKACSKAKQPSSQDLVKESERNVLDCSQMRVLS